MGAAAAPSSSESEPMQPASPAVISTAAAAHGRRRRIAIPAALTLSDLASEILGAFDFDHDHLHCFEYKDRFGLIARVNHPYMDESPFTDEVKVGEVQLQPGEAMRYVFDFGDNWQFKVELESIDPPNRAMKHPEVIESHGKAPQQYRDWDSD